MELPIDIIRIIAGYTIKTINIKKDVLRLSLVSKNFKKATESSLRDIRRIVIHYSDYKKYKMYFKNVEYVSIYLNTSESEIIFEPPENIKFLKFKLGNFTKILIDITKCLELKKIHAIGKFSNTSNEICLEKNNFLLINKDISFELITEFISLEGEIPENIKVKAIGK